MRTYALAIGVAVAATQWLATGGFVDIGKSIYLQPSFSAPLMFCRRRCCSATAWCCRTAAARARWCCSGAAICVPSSSWSCSAIFAQMTLKGLIAPARIAMVAGVADHGEGEFGAGAVGELRASSEMTARMLAASVISARR